jgi:hypothetical protein
MIMKNYYAMYKEGEREREREKKLTDFIARCTNKERLTIWHRSDAVSKFFFSLSLKLSVLSLSLPLSIL